MKIIYTDSGHRALEAFKDRQVRELEERISSKKYVFGDEIVEITAADVKQASEEGHQLPRAFVNNYSATRLLLAIYSVLGVFTSIAGLFWEQLSAMYFRNPIQLALIVSGVAMSVASYAALLRFQARERELDSLKQLEQIEKIQRQISDT